MSLRILATSAFCLVTACGGAPPPSPETPSVTPLPPPPPPLTAEQQAKLDDASARCEADDDCTDLAHWYERAPGAAADPERAYAAALKGCLGGDENICSTATFMRHDIAAPGTHLMTAQKCQGAEQDGFICYELDTLAADEDRASPAVKAACATLQKTGDAAPPGELGPLVDRCPGLATPRQRERARLFRSEDAVTKAMATIGSASPRQVRRVVERLGSDPRAADVLAVGVRRFAQPRSKAFEKARNNILNLPSMKPQLDLCAIDGDAAMLAPVPPSMTSVVLHLVPFLFPPAWPFLFPDAPNKSEEAAADEAARQRAAEVERQVRDALKPATSGKDVATLMMISTCEEARWFDKAPKP